MWMFGSGKTTHGKWYSELRIFAETAYDRFSTMRLDLCRDFM